MKRATKAKEFKIKTWHSVPSYLEDDLRYIFDKHSLDPLPAFSSKKIVKDDMPITLVIRVVPGHGTKAKRKTKGMK